MAYLLDSDTFIQAKNLHYGLDFCPGFWDWIVREHAANRVFSIEKVGDELEAGTDELATWAHARGATASLPEEVAVKQEWSLLVALDRNDFSAAGGRCFH